MPARDRRARIKTNGRVCVCVLVCVYVCGRLGVRASTTAFHPYLAITSPVEFLCPHEKQNVVVLIWFCPTRTHKHRTHLHNASARDRRAGVKSNGRVRVCVCVRVCVSVCEL